MKKWTTRVKMQKEIKLLRKTFGLCVEDYAEKMYQRRIEKR